MNLPVMPNRPADGKPRYAIKVQYFNRRGDTIKTLDWISTRPWNRDEACADHALTLASQLWKMDEGESISVFQKVLGVENAAFVSCDGLDG